MPNKAALIFLSSSSMFSWGDMTVPPTLMIVPLLWDSPDYTLRALLEKTDTLLGDNNGSSGTWLLTESPTGAHIGNPLLLF